MPELPEVEIVRRGLEPAIIGKAFEAVCIKRRDLRVAVPEKFEDVLEGQKVFSTLRRGKYILMFLESGKVIILHLGMSGRVSIYAPGESYEPAKHDHAVFKMDDGGQVVFNDPRRFGMLYLTTEQDWESEKPFNAMGPEPLGNDFHGPALMEKLQGKRTSIKVALLDQRVVSGVGNIYACEALYEAGILPTRQAGSLSEAEAEKLTVAIRSVLERAIQAGGSTLKDYQHTDGTLGYFQHSFSVYDRKGDTCPSCVKSQVGEGCIQRMVQAGRSSFFCARIQS